MEPNWPARVSKNIGSTILFAVYRSHLAGAVALVVPDHTREALFQLFCDLRANTPKDARFLRRHARALTPHTLPGWLALASALGFGFSGAVALACTTALMSLAGVWAAVGLAIASGMFLASVLALLALSLFVSALVSGAMAAGALSAYAAAVAALGCLRLASRLLLGPSRRQGQQQPQAAVPNQRGLPDSANSSIAPARDEQQQVHVQAQGQGHHPPLALPVIRTSPPPRKQTPSPGGSPLASPRKQYPHPAAAAASVALGEAPASAPLAPKGPPAPPATSPTPVPASSNASEDSGSNASNASGSDTATTAPHLAADVQSKGGVQQASPGGCAGGGAGGGAGTPGAPRTPPGAAEAGKPAQQSEVTAAA